MFMLSYVCQTRQSGSMMPQIFPLFKVTEGTFALTPLCNQALLSEFQLNETCTINIPILFVKQKDRIRNQDMIRKSTKLMRWSQFCSKIELLNRILKKNNQLRTIENIGNKRKVGCNILENRRQDTPQNNTCN